MSSNRLYSATEVVCIHCKEEQTRPDELILRLDRTANRAGKPHISTFSMVVQCDSCFLAFPIYREVAMCDSEVHISHYVDFGDAEKYEEQHRFFGIFHQETLIENLKRSIEGWETRLKERRESTSRIFRSLANNKPAEFHKATDYESVRHSLGEAKRFQSAAESYIIAFETIQELVKQLDVETKALEELKNKKAKS